VQPIPTPLVDVIATAIAEPLPCPECGRTPTSSTCRCVKRADAVMQVRATHIATVLVREGWVHVPPAAGPDLGEVARFLAQASGHPRFEEDGWKNLLVAEGEVQMAYRHAMSGVNASLDRERASALGEARTILSDAARRASSMEAL